MTWMGYCLIGEVDGMNGDTMEIPDKAGEYGG